MMKSYKFVITTLLLLFWHSETHLVNGERDEEFEHFFASKLQEYSDWIKQNKLDPSPDLWEKSEWYNANSPSSQLTYYMSNQGVAGLSNIEKTTVDYVTTERPMVVNTTFTTTGNITLFGDYRVNGAIDGVAIREEGKWSVTYESAFQGEWGVTYNHYTNGSLKVQSGFMLDTKFGNATNVEIEYLDHGVGVEFSEELKEALASSLRFHFTFESLVKDHPFHTLFTRYFKDVFANTTWPPQKNDDMYDVSDFQKIP